ncbi:MAG: hypothetical protein L6Q99_10290 [Planctomycetes bacterium]|nr:hypothetical protein [Planctomycetota bacterium]
MATEAPPLATCPTCGVKLKRTNLSLCAYCGSPLQLGAKPTPPDDEVAKRLGRLADHPEFKAKQAWFPIDAEAEAPALKLRGIAGVGFVVGGLVVAAVLLRGEPLGGTWALVGYALVAIGVVGVVASRAWQIALRQSALLRRAAIVLDRRSETDSERGTTNYFFSLRFQDGSEGEFRFRGRGAQYDPMVNGVTGIAFTRGERLVEFQRITG